MVEEIGGIEEGGDGGGREGRRKRQRNAFSFSTSGHPQCGRRRTDDYDDDESYFNSSKLIGIVCRRHRESRLVSHRTESYPAVPFLASHSAVRASTRSSHRRVVAIQTIGKEEDIFLSRINSCCHPWRRAQLNLPFEIRDSNDLI
ncbi:hypothetical protein HZH68_015641 [Vespula germanica]|uniref:Uncharacterized protein n=1 Tax=Vespula germanica TaxID=30212 RepID=A0A834MSW6_VESGE|nr:hypothetical protein HZH68_015641 [Vespula germanica]